MTFFVYVYVSMSVLMWVSGFVGRLGLFIKVAYHKAI